MQQYDEHARPGRQAAVSRATVGRAAGLDWPQTFVLKAVGDLAMELWERRLTLDRVGYRLAVTTRISRQQIEAALDPLGERGYVYADDGFENPEIVLTLTTNGLEEYCQRFIQGYRSIGPEILKLALHDAGLDAVALAHRSGRPALLVEHVLEMAERHGLLRLARTGQYIVVREIRPPLRRWLSGTL